MVCCGLVRVRDFILQALGSFPPMFGIMNPDDAVPVHEMHGRNARRRRVGTARSRLRAGDGAGHDERWQTPSCALADSACLAHG